MRIIGAGLLSGSFVCCFFFCHVKGFSHSDYATCVINAKKSASVFCELVLMSLFFQAFLLIKSLILNKLKRRTFVRRLLYILIFCPTHAPAYCLVPVFEFFLFSFLIHSWPKSRVTAPHFHNLLFAFPNSDCQSGKKCGAESR